MAGDLVLPDVRGYDFGVGLDRLSGNPRNQVVDPTPSPPIAGNGANQKFDVSRVSSTKDMQTKLGIDVAASYGCAAFGAGVSARFQYLNESSVHSSSLFLAITASVQMANLSIDHATLSTNAGQMVDNPDAFTARYGEMFCRACTRGGLFVGLMRIETTSSDEATSISAALKGSYSLFSAEAKTTFSNAINATNASVYCSLYVEGGPPIQVTNPNDPNLFLEQANIWIKAIQEKPDAYARPYEWTMSPISIAEGPLPPNAADLEHAADVLAQCAQERLSLFDERNEMAWYRDHWDQYDATQTPITQQQVADHYKQNQHDLDILARCASAAINHPTAAVTPETFAAAQNPPDSFRDKPVPTPLPPAKPKVTASVVSFLRLRALAVLTVLGDRNMTLAAYDEWTRGYEGTGLSLTQDQFEFIRSGLSFKWRLILSMPDATGASEVDKNWTAGETGMHVYGAWIIGQDPLDGTVAPSGTISLTTKMRMVGGFPHDFEALLPKT